jgi:hypothetical protein
MGNPKDSGDPFSDGLMGNIRAVEKLLDSVFSPGRPGARKRGPPTDDDGQELDAPPEDTRDSYDDDGDDDDGNDDVAVSHPTLSGLSSRWRPTASPRDKPRSSERPAEVPEGSGCLEILLGIGLGIGLFMYLKDPKAHRKSGLKASRKEPRERSEAPGWFKVGCIVLLMLIVGSVLAVVFLRPH